MLGTQDLLIGLALVFFLFGAKRLLLEPGAPQQARSSHGSRRASRLDDGAGEANIPGGG